MKSVLFVENAVESFLPFVGILGFFSFSCASCFKSRKAFLARALSLRKELSGLGFRFLRPSFVSACDGSFVLDCFAVLPDEFSYAEISRVSLGKDFCFDFQRICSEDVLRKVVYFLHGREI